MGGNHAAASEYAEKACPFGVYAGLCLSWVPLWHPLCPSPGIAVWSELSGDAVLDYSRTSMGLSSRHQQFLLRHSDLPSGEYITLWGAAIPQIVDFEKPDIPCHAKIPGAYSFWSSHPVSFYSFAVIPGHPVLSPLWFQAPPYPPVPQRSWHEYRTQNRHLSQWPGVPPEDPDPQAPYPVPPPRSNEGC